MIEIRIHGRGGQGAVTTSQLLAVAAFHDGKQCQAFPNFGVERRGAPTTAFARIDDKPINLRSHVYDPDIVIILDPSLLQAVDVTEGLKEDGVIIINTSKKPEEFKLKAKVHCIDATKIALEIFKRPIVNTAILGGFAKITKLVTVESLCKAVDQKYKGKIAELNKEIIKKVYNE